ncbi:MAG: hypothetical protein ACOX4D_04725 [Bacteroidales bacterium]
MANNNKYCQLMKPGYDYHVYNQGNNGENIFKRRDDRIRFEVYLYGYMQDVVNFYTISLQKNHFHLVIQIKSVEEILAKVDEDELLQDFVERLDSEDEEYIASRVVSELFRRFFMSFAIFFNLKYKRTGSLFRKSFKRIWLHDLQYLRNCIVYVNRNVTHHNPRLSYKTYEWCYYSRFLDDDYIESLKGTFFDFERIFGSKKNFIYLHERKDLYDANYSIE